MLLVWRLSREWRRARGDAPYQNRRMPCRCLNARRRDAHWITPRSRGMPRGYTGAIEDALVINRCSGRSCGQSTGVSGVRFRLRRFKISKNNGRVVRWNHPSEIQVRPNGLQSGLRGPSIVHNYSISLEIAREKIGEAGWLAGARLTIRRQQRI